MSGKSRIIPSFHCRRTAGSRFPTKYLPSGPQARFHRVDESERNPKTPRPPACLWRKRSLRPSFRRERAAMKRGVWPVAGCDEAGRGPLAGPVVAAAVILDPARVPRGLNDSKKLDAAERERLYDRICDCAEVAVAFGSPGADRPRQYPAGFLMGAGARGRSASGPPQSCLRRRPRSHQCAVRLPGRDQRRRTRIIHRRGFDRREGDARPSDEADRGRASGLRLRAPYGLQRARAFRGFAQARADHPPPAVIFAGRARLWRYPPLPRGRRPVACLKAERLSVFLDRNRATLLTRGRRRLARKIARSTGIFRFPRPFQYQ